MPKSISAFQTNDGRVFASRPEAEKYEIRTGIVKRFANDVNFTDYVIEKITEDREWFEKLLSDVRKDLPSTFIEPVDFDESKPVDYQESDLDNHSSNLRKFARV